MNDSVSRKIKYLTEMGCGEVHHSGGTLIEHLAGVHDILVQNKAPSYVCDAGLFHSIYGTVSFEHKTTEDRNQIRELIGSAAENLVYEFSILERPRTYFIGELSDGQLRQDLTLLNGANEMEMNSRPTPEMSMEEAYGHIGFDSGRNL